MSDLSMMTVEDIMGLGLDFKTNAEVVKSRDLYKWLTNMAEELKPSSPVVSIVSQTNTALVFDGIIPLVYDFKLDVGKNELTVIQVLNTEAFHLQDLVEKVLLISNDFKLSMLNCVVKSVLIHQINSIYVNEVVFDIEELIYE